MVPIDSSYRSSHLSKGSEYHEEFEIIPYRKLIWEIEKQALFKIYEQQFRDTEVRHLDFACGTGRVIELFEGIASFSTGIDVSKSMLAVAEARLHSVEFIEADLTVGGVLANRKFDFITAFRFFAIAEPELRRQAMAALAERLAPDGIIVFNNHKQTNSLTQIVANIVGKGDKITMSHEEVEHLTTGSGLRIERSIPIGILPISEHWRWIPTGAIRILEDILSKLPGIDRLSSNRIYVCNRG